MTTPRTHQVTIAGCKRLLPVVPANDHISFAFLDILGDTELIDRATRAIVDGCPASVEVILGADTVGLVVAHHASVVSGKPYVVARKKRTPTMHEPLTAVGQSVAASSPSTFYLNEVQAKRIAGRHVLVVDEVCSTGSTIEALRALATEAGAARVSTAVFATEGTRRPDVFALVHLPVWETGEGGTAHE